MRGGTPFALLLLVAGAYAIVNSQGDPKVHLIAITAEVIALMGFLFGHLPFRSLDFRDGDLFAFAAAVLAQLGTTIMFSALFNHSVIPVLQETSLPQGVGGDPLVVTSIIVVQAAGEEMLFTGGLYPGVAGLIPGGAGERRTFGKLLTAATFTLFHAYSYLGLTTLQAIRAGLGQALPAFLSTFTTQLVKCWVFDQLRGVAGLSLGHAFANLLVATWAGVV